MTKKTAYILMISIHGLIRGKNPELGRDADTGGQTKYVLELAGALGAHRQVDRVDLMTRLIQDPKVDGVYGQKTESLGPGAQIVRIPCGPEEYIPKEELWDWLDNFTDNALYYLQQQQRLPDIIHSHYADAGYVGARLAHLLGIPLVHTGHSLGRSKRKRLLAGGLSGQTIEKRYNMNRRINAEEEVLGAAELVITSTKQEIQEQYAQYDYYQPDQMRVIPPGTDLEKFHPPTGQERKTRMYRSLTAFWRRPKKPMILALSRPDHRKNIHSLMEAYGRSTDLQKKANLAIVAGTREDIAEMEPGARNVLTNLLLDVDRYDLYGRCAYPKHHRSEDVPVIYRLAALSRGVFVNPALTEPFGLTLIEAAASGLPVVATEDGGPVDIIANCNNGHLIDPLDTETMSQVLHAILEDDDQWSRLAANGLNGVKKHYTWKAHVEEYLRILSPLIQRPTRSTKPHLRRRPSMYAKGALVSGIDQNLLGDPNSLGLFREQMHRHRKSVCLCIATGRSLDSALKAIKKHKIPQPDVLITGLGTQIQYFPELIPDTAWTEHIEHLWNRKAVVRILEGIPGLIMQPKKEQSDFKVSYYYDPALAPAVEDIRKILLQNNQTVNVVFSFGQFLDIIPVRASKGFAVRRFAAQWDIRLDHILTAGGSGADEDMMRGNTLSVVVANRHYEELSDLTAIEPIYFSQAEFAAGILEGIEHYDFFRLCEES